VKANDTEAETLARPDAWTAGVSIIQDGRTTNETNQKITPETTIPSLWPGIKRGVVAFE
jgi:hypothetical protein